MDQAYTMVEEAANVLSDWRLKRAAQEKAARAAAEEKAAKEKKAAGEKAAKK